MTMDITALAPFLSPRESEALGDCGLPFDAIALYIRVFCYFDAGNGKPVAVSRKVMVACNGMVLNNNRKPMREARLKTLIKHLERVGLIDKPVPGASLKFEREYTRLLSGGPTSITAFEYQRLKDISLSYEALSLYVRAIRPMLNIHTFEAVTSVDTITQALTFTPISGSSDKYVHGARLIKPALLELVNTGLINYKTDGHFYCFTCHVSNAFNTNWLKTLGIAI